MHKADGPRSDDGNRIAKRNAELSLPVQTTTQRLSQSTGNPGYPLGDDLDIAAFDENGWDAHIFGKTAIILIADGFSVQTHVLHAMKAVETLAAGEDRVHTNPVSL